MLTGEVPFSGAGFEEVSMKIVSSTITNWPEHLVDSERNLISSLLDKDVEKRRLIGNAIRQQPYLDDTPWESIEKKEIVSPYIPDVDGPLDTKHYETYPDSLNLPRETVVPEEAFKDYEMVVS